MHDDDFTRSIDTRPRWGEVGIHGVHRLREWDAVVTVDAAELEGDELELVVLAQGDERPFARALAGELEPPYRARGVRKEGSRWAVGARRIEVAELPELDGAELTFTLNEGVRTLVVDGRPTIWGIDALERVAGGRFESYVLEGRRLDADIWEVRLSPL